MQFVMENLPVILAVVMIADKIVKLTPTEKDDAIVDSIKGILSFFKKK